MNSMINFGWRMSIMGRKQSVATGGLLYLEGLFVLLLLG